MYGIIQALITYSYERIRDLLYFGDTHTSYQPSHTGTGLRSQSPRTLESDLQTKIRPGQPNTQKITIQRHPTICKDPTIAPWRSTGASRRHFGRRKKYLRRNRSHTSTNWSRDRNPYSWTTQLQNFRNLPSWTKPPSTTNARDSSKYI